MDDGRYRAIFHSPMLPADAFQAAKDEMRICPWPWKSPH